MGRKDASSAYWNLRDVLKNTDKLTDQQLKLIEKTISLIDSHYNLSKRYIR